MYLFRPFLIRSLCHTASFVSSSLTSHVYQCSKYLSLPLAYNKLNALYYLRELLALPHGQRCFAYVEANVFFPRYLGSRLYHHPVAYILASPATAPENDEQTAKMDSVRSRSFPCDRQRPRPAQLTFACGQRKRSATAAVPRGANLKRTSHAQVHAANLSDRTRIEKARDSFCGVGHRLLVSEVQGGHAPCFTGQPPGSSPATGTSPAHIDGINTALPRRPAVERSRTRATRVSRSSHTAVAGLSAQAQP